MICFPLVNSFDFCLFVNIAIGVQINKPTEKMTCKDAQCAKGT